MSVRVGIAIIARNNERTIAACLTSVQDEADAITVLDTGSTDRTMKIASRPGVQVLSEPWRSEDLGDGIVCLTDFAAARNRALEATDTEFVMIIDTDQRYLEGTVRKARERFSAHPDASGGYLLEYEAARSDAHPRDVVSGKWSRGNPLPIPYAFQRIAPDGTIRSGWYTNPIHEMPHEWIAKMGGGMVPLEGASVHYGHNARASLEKKKTLRNLKLLMRWCEQDNTNPTAWTYLAATLLSADWRDYDAAKVAAAKAWDLRHDPRAAGQSSRLAMSLTEIALGSVERPLEITLSAVNELAVLNGDSHGDFDYLRGLLCENLGRLDEAMEHYLNAWEFDPRFAATSVDKGIIKGRIEKLRDKHGIQNPRAIH